MTKQVRSIKRIYAGIYNIVAHDGLEYDLALFKGQWVVLSEWGHGGEFKTKRDAMIFLSEKA